MTLQALLVSKDDDAADVLSRAMAPFGIGVERSSDPEIAAARIEERGFDLIVVDFDEPGSASSILHLAKNQCTGKVTPGVTIALVGDERQFRAILGAGAHFILPKPVSPEQASASLRAAAALLRHERRRSIRVPVQAAATLTTADGDGIEGILLDLSDSGMDVLAAQPLTPSALLQCRFALPDGSFEVATEGEVAWANPNGQCGIHFLNMEETLCASLRTWLQAYAPEANPEEEDSVDACKLTDLSLGGCYVQTASPFPENSSIDLCLKVEGLEIHAGGTVRVMHPNFGMGIEFPSRTEEQRKTVGDFIEFLTSRPGITPELVISPKALVANETDLAAEPDPNAGDDPLLSLLRVGQAMEQQDFLQELHQQRNSEPVNS